MISGIADSSVHHDLRILTDFGDAAVLLPLSLVFFLWLLTTARVGTALLWLLILAFCNALLAVLKFYFLACPAGISLHSPSGHTGFGIYVYGSLTAVLALSVGQRWLRSAIVVTGTVLIAVMAASRLILGYHSIVEILIGAVIGGGALAVFIPIYTRGPVRRGPVVWLTLIALMVALIFHGEKVTAEGYLRQLGWEMGLGGAACGFR
jgi:membrane-associated phospholipid phosphatase